MKPTVQQVKLSQIVFDEAIYPRQAHDPALVQRYADTLEVIEAAGRYLELTPELVLLNGKHRYLAYRTRYAEEPSREIPVYVWPIEAEAERWDFACESNSDSGLQLTVEDKIHAAIRMYTRYGRPQEHIAKTLRVNLNQVNAWLSRTLKEQKDRENARILDLWLACYTEAKIAEQLTLPRQTVNERLQVLPGSYRDKNSAKLLFQDDFDAPLYNVWKQQEKSNRVAHFGNSFRASPFIETPLGIYQRLVDMVATILDPLLPRALHNKSGLHKNTMTCTKSHADGDSGSGRLSREQGVDGG